MIFNKIRMISSIIGDFSDLLINYEQRVKNMLLDYEIQTKVDKLPDGREVKLLLFTNQNVCIRFMPNRVDYEFNIRNRETNIDAIYEPAKKFFTLFGEIFPDYAGNRIAIVINGFIDNTDDHAIISLADRFNLTTCFGECNELALKINTPVQGREQYNSVLNIDMGAATNSKTKEQTKVLLVSLDVNTMAVNKTPRFNACNFDRDFIGLKEELENRLQQIENL